jgi:hypothetical protein
MIEKEMHPNKNVLDLEYISPEYILYKVQK